ncbi:hypothetical protein BABINDRAFT_160627 [Babjeviella inositovora NRRL Y-12698]|uniref:FMP27 GFWDK domain-containing protein n=1 Tax=Babjeviella inositovora NRRL Y-12698 TaxID=984486 RepID=A0A1E3QUA4_9ASCO|nr:uncharacterized protein BABINDRAFT_160627 [Babjeviella inositovora NRRL Y-12698]ODQ81250.1 hypothetical protein BABINDRAFT_160627 [Babjeviella inositovora NRRL Y-12698]
MLKHLFTLLCLWICLLFFLPRLITLCVPKLRVARFRLFAIERITYKGLISVGRISFSFVTRTVVIEDLQVLKKLKAKAKAKAPSKPKPPSSLEFRVPKQLAPLLRLLRLAFTIEFTDIRIYEERVPFTGVHTTEDVAGELKIQQLLHVGHLSLASSMSGTSLSAVVTLKNVLVKVVQLTNDDDLISFKLEAKLTHSQGVSKLASVKLFKHAPHPIVINCVTSVRALIDILALDLTLLGFTDTQASQFIECKKGYTSTIHNLQFEMTNAAAVEWQLDVEQILVATVQLEQVHPMLAIPWVKVRKTDIISVEVADVDLAFSVTAVFLVYLVTNIFLRHYASLETPEPKAPKTGPPAQFQLSVPSILINARIPNEEKVLFEIDNLKVSQSASAPLTTSVANIRLFVCDFNATIPSDVWCRAVTISDFAFSDFQITSSFIRIYIPKDFLVYKIIDNLVTLFKVVRQINYNFKQLRRSALTTPPTIINPHKEDAKMVPRRLSIKASKFLFTLTDDAFESELGLVFQLGRVEQIKRLSKMDMFERTSRRIVEEDYKQWVREQKIKLSADSPVKVEGKENLCRLFKECGTQTNCSIFKKREEKKKNGSKRTESSRSNFNPVDSKTSGSTDHPDWYPEVDYSQDPEYLLHRADLEEEIADARDRLLANFSRSWTTSFKATKGHRLKFMDNLKELYGGAEAFSDVLLSKYRVLRAAHHSSLFAASLLDLEVIVDRPSFDNVYDFMYMHGQHQPKMDMCTLIPMHLEVISSHVLIVLRDYPLPMLHFPQSHSSAPAFHLHGDLVVGETVPLYHSMRYIWVPFLSMFKDCHTNTFFSLLTPRTLSPVKFYHSLVVDIASEKSSIFSWSRATHSALQFMTQQMDNFTKPPVDPSVKIGFWDKVRLLMHGSFVMNVKNDLNLYVKGSMNPYDMIGNGAGMVFTWRDNVRLAINDDHSKDFMVVKSDSFVFAVPDLSAAQQNYWGLGRKKQVKRLVDYDFVKHDHPYAKIIMRFTSQRQVRWKLGFLFQQDQPGSGTESEERAGYSPRTTQLTPHWDVNLWNPIYLDDPQSHDSFAGFRSKYFHMYVSIISETESSTCGYTNNLYLSPNVGELFREWWRTLFHATNLPVRSGNLYNRRELDNRPGDKFGQRLFSIEYQLRLQPLMISSMNRNKNFETLAKDTFVSITGSKAKLDRFSLDLHHVKEVLKRLVDTPDFWKLKISQGELDCENIDIRLLNAVFNERAAAGYLALMLSLTDSHSTSESFSSSGSVCEATWMDPLDFIEIDIQELTHTPKVTLVPLLYSPRLSYMRNCKPKYEVPFPFGQKPLHDCLFDQSHPEDIQEAIAHRRAKVLSEQIHSLERVIHELGADQVKRDQLKQLKHSLHLVHCVIDDLVVLKEVDLESLSGDDLSDAEPLSRNLSRRSSARSLSIIPSRELYDEIKETGRVTSENEFHNRFILHDPQLKWSNKTRDIMADYGLRISDRRALQYFMSRNAVKYVEDLITLQLKTPVTDKPPKENDFDFAQFIDTDLVQEYARNLTAVDSDDHEVDMNYYVQLISPQIQLVSDKRPNSCMLITSRDLEMKIVAVNDSTVEGLTDIDELSRLSETRYGVLLRDAHFYVIEEMDVIAEPYLFYNNNYGNEVWSPWLPMEFCYDSSPLSHRMIVEKSSLGLLLRKSNPLYVNASSQCKMYKVHLPKLTLTCDNHQYNIVYDIVLDLLMFSSHDTSNNLQKLEKFLDLSEYESFAGMDRKIRELQFGIRTLNKLKRNLRLQQDSGLVTAQDITDFDVEIYKLVLELLLLMRMVQKTALLVTKGHQETTQFVVNVDEFIWHMVGDDKVPLVDFAFAKALFQSTLHPGGLGHNNFVVKVLQGFNLKNGSRFPELLSPLVTDSGASKDPAPLINVKWTEFASVGGIKTLHDAVFDVRPLKIEVDYNDIKPIMAYLFHSLSDKSAKPDGSTSPRSSASSFTFSDDESDLDVSAQKSSDTGRLGPLLNFMKKHGIKEAPKKEDRDEVSEMLLRSSTYKRIDRFKIRGFMLLISFKGDKKLKIIDVQNLVLRVPDMQYEAKIWSSKELLSALKKDAIKVVLSHTGTILGNKLTHHKKKHATSRPLPQLTSYAAFTSAHDLANEQPHAEPKNVLHEHLHGHKHLHKHQEKSSLENIAYSSTPFENPVDSYGLAVIDETDLDVAEFKAQKV